MIIGRSRFNIYLLFSLAGLLMCGCVLLPKKDPKAKQLSTVRLHLAASFPADEGHSVKVKIFRANPMNIEIQKDPFLTEANIAGAEIVEVPGGGFDLKIQFDRQGTWILEQYSATNPGKHFAIFSQFGEKGKQSRWLGAPPFNRLISKGAIQFAPDASREEAEEIVLGLKNVAKQVEKKSKW